ncbi:MAG: glycosyl hydrolase 2 galactose-binding domain-containing protein [Actinomycetes bacterium]
MTGDHAGDRTDPSTRALGGPWWAAPADESRRRTLPDPGAPMDGWVQVEVPGQWADQPQLEGALGEVLHRVEFDLPPTDETERTWLVLDGVAGTADVWMDGDLLGDTDAPYLQHTFEITDVLALHDRRLVALDVACPPAKTSSRRDLLGALRADGGGPPGGVWRLVRTERTGPVRLGDLQVRCTSASHQRGELWLRASLDTLLPRTVTVRTTVTGPDGATTDARAVPLAAGLNRQVWTVPVVDPPRWWPHSLGEPTTVEVGVEVELADDDPERGDDPVSHRVVRRSGLRTLVREPAGWRINGELLFLQGVSLRDAGDETDGLRDHLARLVGAGADLVRVVGRPPAPALWDAADELGLLVWADLPVVGHQHRSTVPRAVRQARRLVAATSHHPSVALWCCHDRRVLGRDLLVGDRALAGAVSTADPDVPVLLRAPAAAPTVQGTRGRWPWSRPAPLLVAPPDAGWDADPDHLARLVGAARSAAHDTAAGVVVPEPADDAGWDALTKVFARRSGPARHA